MIDDSDDDQDDDDDDDDYMYSGSLKLMFKNTLGIVCSRILHHSTVRFIRRMSSDIKVCHSVS